MGLVNDEDSRLDFGQNENENISKRNDYEICLEKKS
jgi:hypothetical protein